MLCTIIDHELVLTGWQLDIVVVVRLILLMVQ